MTSDDVEVVTGRLQRGDADISTNVEAQVRDKQGISFRFRKGTIVVGEMLKLLASDRAIEFVVNAELPAAAVDEGDTMVDGRILKDHSIEPTSAL